MYALKLVAVSCSQPLKHETLPCIILSSPHMNTSIWETTNNTFLASTLTKNESIGNGKSSFVGRTKTTARLAVVVNRNCGRSLPGLSGRSGFRTDHPTLDRKWIVGESKQRWAYFVDMQFGTIPSRWGLVQCELY
mmetsp:Transcript_11782/g.21771  ORF Transcript_11782/g.21771 Transcript_11782/m.21771 type:complete len:135 (+) Transcript_11782:33-437(+)